MFPLSNHRHEARTGPRKTTVEVAGGAITCLLIGTWVALNRRFYIENRAIQNRAIRIVRFKGRFKR